MSLEGTDRSSTQTKTRCLFKIGFSQLVFEYSCHPLLDESRISIQEALDNIAKQKGFFFFFKKQYVVVESWRCTSFNLHWAKNNNWLEADCQRRQHWGQLALGVTNYKPNLRLIYYFFGTKLTQKWIEIMKVLSFEKARMNVYKDCLCPALRAAVLILYHAQRYYWSWTTVDGLYRQIHWQRCVYWFFPTVDFLKSFHDQYSSRSFQNTARGFIQ